MQKALRDLWRETSEDKHANDRGRAKQRFYSGCFRFLRLYAGFKLQLIRTDVPNCLSRRSVNAPSFLRLPLPRNVFGLSLQEKEAASGFHRHNT